MGDLLTFTYAGPSMYPALRPGDLLTVEPGAGGLCSGDIIVFQAAGEQITVHRIVASTRSGLRTKGDNNSEPDPVLHDSSCILGRVCAVTRKGRTWKLCRGPLQGRWKVFVLGWRKKMEQGLIAVLGPLYSRFSGGSLLAQLFSVVCTPRFLFFSKKEGTEVQLIIGRKIIGRYLPREKRWTIQRPFRLVIDERTLPAGKQ